MRTLLYSLLFCLSLGFTQNLGQVESIFTTSNNYPAWHITFNSEGSLLAAALWDEDDSIRILDGYTGREVHKLLGHQGDVNSVAFSPNGKLLASGSDDNVIKIWEIDTQRVITNLHGHSYPILSVNFSPDGRLLASGSWDNTIKIWEIDTGREVANLSGHSSAVNSVSFSPNGRLLASGSWDNTIKIWEINTGREVASLLGHSSAVTSVSFSPDGRLLASGSFDKTIKIWRLDTNIEIASLSGHASGISSVAFNPNESILASGALIYKDDKDINPGTVKLWSTPNQDKVFCDSSYCSNIRYTSLTIHSTPGAKVSINGYVIPENIGSEGIFNVVVEEGIYTIDINKEGYENSSTTLQVTSNENNEVYLTLTPLERRVALVIGNSTYIDNPLKNPVNDAQAIATVLRSLDFEVIERIDLNKTEMEAALTEFERTLQEGDVGLIYFSGHGAEVEGKNYLIPTNATPKDDIELKYQSIALDTMLESLANKRARFSIVILDACRNNPFSNTLSHSRSNSSGLARISGEDLSRNFRPQVHSVSNEARGIYIAFATEPGAVAEDGSGNHSPYTESLLKHLSQMPQMEIEQLFRHVREDVYQVTNHKQLPWHNTNILGEFYFASVD